MISFHSYLTPRSLLREFILSYGLEIISKAEICFRILSSGQKLLSFEMFNFQFPGSDRTSFEFHRRIHFKFKSPDFDEYICLVSFGSDVLNNNGRILSFSLYSSLGTMPQNFSPLATVTYVFHKHLGNMKWIDIHHLSSSFGDLFMDEFTGGPVPGVNHQSRFVQTLDVVHEWVAEFSFFEFSALQPKPE